MQKIALNEPFNLDRDKIEKNQSPSLQQQINSLRIGESNSPCQSEKTVLRNYFSMPMSIRRKRTSPTMEESRSKKAKVVSWNKKDGGRSNDPSSTFSSKRCIAWFHEYAEMDEDVLGPEGMEKFCEDIGVEPENIVMLSLAWKLDAKNMGFFTKAEWLKGMTELYCDCQSKLQDKLEYLRSLLDDPVQFKDIYRYAFDFARDKDQRSMDVDTAKAMLTLLLGKHWSLFTSFHQFLEQSKYKVINKDQWCNILEFSRSILPDLSNYDEDGAWPVLLDEYVEWYKEHRAMNS